MYIIIILLLIALAGIYYYLSQIIDSQRNHILVLSKENEALKKRYAKSSLNYSSLTIRFSPPPEPFAYTKDNCTIYIAPLEDLPYIAKINVSTEIRVLSMAEVLNSVWYEISIPVESSYNSKGWIKASDIIFNETLALRVRK